MRWYEGWFEGSPFDIFCRFTRLQGMLPLFWFYTVIYRLITHHSVGWIPLLVSLAIQFTGVGMQIYNRGQIKFTAPRWRRRGYEGNTGDHYANTQLPGITACPSCRSRDIWGYGPVGHGEGLFDNVRPTPGSYLVVCHDCLSYAEGVTLKSAVKNWIALCKTTPISEDQLKEVTDTVNAVVKEV